MRNKSQSNQWPLWIGAIALCVLASSCKPDDSPFKAENESLRKQLAKQESVVTSLQDGNKVMHQQIDLLNQELRDAKKSAESAKTEAKAASDNLAVQAVQAKKLSADVQKTAAAQAAQSIYIEEKGAQTEDLEPQADQPDCGRLGTGAGGFHARRSVGFRCPCLRRTASQRSTRRAAKFTRDGFQRALNGANTAAARHSGNF